MPMITEGLKEEVLELRTVERNEAKITQIEVSRQESTRPVQETVSVMDACSVILDTVPVNNMQRHLRTVLYTRW